MPKRTTVTIADDVLDKLLEEARKSGETLRTTLDRVLRRGLHPGQKGKPRKFKIRGPFARGKPGVSFDNIEELLDQIYGPWRR